MMRKEILLNITILKTHQHIWKMKPRGLMMKAMRLSSKTGLGTTRMNKVTKSKSTPLLSKNHMKLPKSQEKAQCWDLEKESQHTKVWKILLIQNLKEQIKVFSIHLIPIKKTKKRNLK
jgi:hypothetical protein